MRIDSQIEVKGQFWDPEDDNEKFQGTLTISDGGEIGLRITYEFRSFDSPLANVGRIVGQVDNFGFVTLDNCWVITNGFNNSRLASAEFFVDTLLCGIALDRNEDILFSSATFTLEGLDEWLHGRSIEANRLKPNKLDVSFLEKQTIEFQLSNGWSVELSFPYTYQTDGRSISARQHTYIKLGSQAPEKAEVYRTQFHNLARFFSFARGAVCCIKDVQFKSTEIARVDSTNRPSEFSMPYFYRSLPFIRTSETAFVSLFQFEDIEAALPDLFDRWNAICEKYKPALWLYISCLSNQYVNPDAKFLAIMQAAENLLEYEEGEFGIEESEYENLKSTLITSCPAEHKEWLENILKYANKPSLRRKLKTLVQPFRTLFGNEGERQQLVKLAKDTRDYLTHYDERMAGHAAKGRELHALKYKIEKAFEFKLMLLMGFDADKIISIVKRNKQIVDKLRV